MSAANPWRIVALSSTIATSSMILGPTVSPAGAQRSVEAHLGPRSRRRGDREVASQVLRPPAQVGEAVAAGGSRRIEAAAVVREPHLQASAGDRHVELDLLTAAVAQRVVQGLSEDQVEVLPVVHGEMNALEEAQVGGLEEDARAGEEVGIGVL